MTTTTLNLNSSNFVIFKNRDFGRRGDKGTWARFDSTTATLTINKAAHGLISDAFTQELRDFCDSYGINFDAMPCGTRESVVIG